MWRPAPHEKPKMSQPRVISVSARTPKNRIKKAATLAGVYALVALSAVGAKRMELSPTLFAVDVASAANASVLAEESMGDFEFIDAAFETEIANDVSPVLDESGKPDLRIRYFDGRACRPVRTVWMKVTAYSPDHRSCGKWADGYTASSKSVWTNAMQLVAADPKVLPIGSIISVPGYAHGDIVPVLDIGGAIKGSRLDVLYPSHSIARKWGVQKLPVVIWEYVEDE